MKRANFRSVELVLALLLTGCLAGEVTITLNNGRTLEGRIGNSDRRDVYLDGKPTARSTIREIDHPGAGITAIGVLQIAVSTALVARSCSGEFIAQEGGFSCTLGQIGIPLGIYEVIAGQVELGTCT